MTPDLEQKKDLICRAIADRLVIEFHYHDQRRVVEPYQCGIGIKDNWQLSGFQVEGKSASNPKLGWRKFLVSDMTGVKITGKTFSGWAGDRRLYNPADKAFKTIFCRVPR
jgi:hypothetical protein